jgi:glycosyltransferase involved in cell wall biosynthesis
VLTGAPLLVHWEDDEWRIRDDPMGRSLPRRLLRPARRWISRLYPPVGCVMTRAAERWVTANAAGLDALTPALADHVRTNTRRQCEVILPITPMTARPANGLSPDLIPSRLAALELIMWTGAVTPSSEADLRLALDAMALVQARRPSVAFVHAGAVLDRYDPLRWARDAGVAEDRTAFLGYVPYPQVPSLLKRAAVLLQSGHPSEYNRLRLPSKVQAYLAAGIPTITYACGFGEMLEDRREALLTRTGDPSELAALILEVLEDDQLRGTLAAGGPSAATRLFDPTSNTDALLGYYRQAIGDRRSAAGSRATESPRPAGRDPVSGRA